MCSFCGARQEDTQALIMGDRNTTICDACLRLATRLVKERPTPPGDMVLDNISQLATNNPRFPGVLGLVSDAVVAIRRGKIVWAGPSERLPQGLAGLPSLDCGGRAVIPGLIDAHTHLLFGGDRSHEFVLRAWGMPAAKAAVHGGGDIHTAQTTRAMRVDDFTDLIRARLDRMLDQGTTTAEAAAGYTAEYQDELDLLEAAGMINQRHMMDLVATFDVTGLPEAPPDRASGLEILTGQVLPQAAELRYAVRVAFGKGAFSTEEARLLLASARAAGARIRLHCGDLMNNHTSRLALDTGAAVIDHCGIVDRNRIKEMGSRGTAVVITPVTALANHDYRPPLRDLVDLGIPVAIGTDCRPVPVLAESMPLAVSLAVLEMGLTPDQAIWSATRGGAAALGLTDRGWIDQGAVADLVVLDAPSPAYLSYRPGADLIWKVIKNGAVVVSR